jgi:hypothetical protein
VVSDRPAGQRRCDLTGWLRAEMESLRGPSAVYGLQLNIATAVLALLNLQFKGRRAI